MRPGPPAAQLQIGSTPANAEAPSDRMCKESSNPYSPGRVTFSSLQRSEIFIENGAQTNLFLIQRGEAVNDTDANFVERLNLERVRFRSQNPRPAESKKSNGF